MKKQVVDHVLLVPCPQCGAEPLVPCQMEPGTRRRTHKSRFRNAAERARYSTLDEGSVSVPARPTGFETNRRRH